MGDTDSSAEPGKMRIAIVGTGPVSLLRALVLATKNPSAEITLFDSASQVGGAWYPERSPGGHLIESGCHIWSHSPPVYRYIEKVLGVPLFPMKPPPVFITSKLKLPYSLKNTLETYSLFFGKLARFQFKSIAKLNKKASTNYRIFGKPNLYPKTGSYELIEVLTKKIAEQPSIKIMLNTRITQLAVGEKVMLNSESESFFFEQVYLTYVSHITTLQLPGGTIQTVPKLFNYVHFLVSSDEPLKKKMTYWRLMSDPVVHRMTDISYQTGREENLFLIGIKEEAFSSTDPEALFVHVKKLMHSHGLISATQKLDLVKVLSFATYYMDWKLKKTLREFSPKIDVLHSTDLMYGFYYLLRSEMPHLIKTPK